jgi:hypothetical protein
MKKNCLILLLLTAAAFTAHSQQLLFTPNDSAEISAIVTDEWEPNDVHLGLVNNTANPITVTWGMLNYTAPVGWEVKLCDNNNCYDLLINSGPYESSSIPAGDTMDFKFQYTAHLITGTGSTNVYAYVTGDSAGTAVVLNYKANLTFVSGIADDFPRNNLRVFPNPVQHSFVVDGMVDAKRASYAVYDLKGALVDSRTKTTNKGAEISIETLPAGEYILKAFDETGKVTGSSRLNKVD